MNIADTFPRAMEKLSMAENTSDIGKDSDSNVAKLKRRRHAQKIISDDEEKNSEDDVYDKENNDDNVCDKENSEDDVCAEVCTKKYLPRFPMPPQAKYNRKENSSSNSGYLKRKCETKLSNIIDIQKMRKNTAEKNKLSKSLLKILMDPK